MVEALLHEIGTDASLADTGLLQTVGVVRPSLHSSLNDRLVESLILPIFDGYDFHAGRVDVLGAVFETLARRGEKDTRVGQFFTPAQVVEFGADLVEFRPTDVVLDPAVGTGRFLISAMDRMLSQADSTDRNRQDVEEAIRQRQLLGSDIDEWVSTIAKMNMYIHGDGKSGIASVNGLVLGDRDVFRHYTGGLNGKVDVVLTNPPLGDTDYTIAERAWEALGDSSVDAAEFYQNLGVVPMMVLEETTAVNLEARRQAAEERIAQIESLEPAERPRNALTRLRRSRDQTTEQLLEIRSLIRNGEVTRRPRGQSMKGGALFLGALARYLQPVRNSSLGIEWQGGRAVVVVDEAILNTPEYARTREFVRRNFFIKAVVSLSRDAFKYLAHTDAKTSVLYLIKKSDPTLRQKEPIFFSHAERVGYGATGNWVGDDLPQILQQYRLFQASVLASYQGRHVVPEDALRATHALADHGSGFFSRLDSGTGSGRLDFYDARFAQRREELTERYGQLIRLGDVLKVAKVDSPPASRTGEYSFAVATRTGTIAYKGQASVDYSPSDLWVVEAGDLVLSSIDLVNGAVAVAHEDVQGLVMSKEMYAYRLKEGSEAVLEYIQIMLRTPAAREMLLGFTTGTSNRTRLEKPEQLLNFPIPPLPSLHEQKEKAEELRAAYALHKEANERLARLQEEAERTLRQLSSSAPATITP